MDWYYAEGAEKVGPLSDGDFDNLIRSGKIRAETLVWRAGMPDWAPYSTVAPNPSPPVAAAAPPAAAIRAGTGEVQCAECGKMFPPDEVVRLQSSWVCATCKPMAMQKMREGIRPEHMDYAGFWIRFAAKFVDGLVLGIPSIILYFALFRNAVSGGAPPSLGFQAFVQIFSVLGGALYTTLMVGKFGATVGKMACGLRIVTADGQAVSYPRALGRHFAELLSGIICYIGYIMVGFDDQKRSLHDRICNTRVIRIR